MRRHIRLKKLQGVISIEHLINNRIKAVIRYEDLYAYNELRINLEMLDTVWPIDFIQVSYDGDIRAILKPDRWKLIMDPINDFYALEICGLEPGEKENDTNTSKLGNITDFQ